MNIEYLIKLRNDAYQKGIPQDRIESYLNWKLKFQELDVPLPDTDDDQELQRVYDMFKKLKDYEDNQLLSDDEDVDNSNSML